MESTLLFRFAGPYSVVSEPGPEEFRVTRDSVLCCTAVLLGVLGEKTRELLTPSRMAYAFHGNDPARGTAPARHGPFIYGGFF